MEFSADTMMQKKVFYIIVTLVIVAIIIMVWSLVYDRVSFLSVFLFIICIIVSWRLMCAVVRDSMTHIFIHNHKVLITVDYDENYVHQLGCEYIDFIISLEHSIFRIPGVFFVAKANRDLSIFFSTYLLSSEDRKNLLFYIKEFADHNSIPINYTIEFEE